MPECRALDSTPIEDIDIDPKLRDSMSAVVRGLQSLYCNPVTRATLFTILKTHFQPGTRKDVGRPGMDLWRVIVFAIVKQCLNLDVDLLLHHANRDSLLRQLLGHGNRGFDPAQYSRQRLADNVQLLTPELIDQVNHLTVQAGHEVAGKKCGAALRGRCDSRVAKTHVHFPTDVGLCWDAVRCLIRTCAKAAEAFAVPAWRKHADRTRKVYKAFQQVRAAPRYWRNGVKTYLRQCKKNATSVPGALACHVRYGRNGGGAGKDRAVSAEVVVDQIRRRILGGEKSPHAEKVFSIHKPHTRWISKGKAGVLPELGLPVAVVEDEYQFILAHHIMWEGSDTDVAVPIIDAVQEVFPSFNACSFDRGFHSKKNREELDARLAVNALPKKGKLNQADRVRENAPAFKAARQQHPAIELCLANLGLRSGALVREKSPENFALMVSLSVLAVNVHRLGCLVRDQCGASVSEDARRRPTPPQKKCLTHMAPSTRDTYALLARIQHYSSRKRPAPGEKKTPTWPRHQ